jgi:hydrogenase nickel incorporation protein HypA/HybF
MHELGIAAEIVEVACARSGGARVRHVVVRVGRGSAVLPEALEMAFALAAEGTAAEGARIEIVRAEGEELLFERMEID